MQNSWASYSCTRVSKQPPDTVRDRQSRRRHSRRPSTPTFVPASQYLESQSARLLNGFVPSSDNGSRVCQFVELLNGSSQVRHADARGETGALQYEHKCFISLLFFLRLCRAFLPSLAGPAPAPAPACFADSRSREVEVVDWTQSPPSKLHPALLQSASHSPSPTHPV